MKYMMSNNSWCTNEKDVVIAVVGVTGSGKSSFIQRVTKSMEIVVGDGLESVTQEIAQYKFDHDGVRYVLIDTPGFDDSVRDDEDVFYELAGWLEKSYRDGQRINGLIYLHPIIGNRERGSETRNLRMFKKLCGKDNFSNVVLGLTFCDQEEDEVIARRLDQLTQTSEWWGEMVSLGAQVEIVGIESEVCLALLSRFARGGVYNNNAQSSPMSRKLTLKIQSELVERNMSLQDTSAAQTIVHKHELDAIRERERTETAQLQFEFQQRMAAASVAYEQKMALMEQQYHLVRMKQEQTYAMLQKEKQLQAELERKEQLLQSQAREREAAHQKEMAVWEEQIRRIKEENARTENRLQKQKELAAMTPRILKRVTLGTSDIESFLAWKGHGHWTQTYREMIQDGQDQVLGFLGAFCYGCLKSFYPREIHYRCVTCQETGGMGVGRILQSSMCCLCQDCKTSGKTCYNSEHTTFTEEKCGPIFGLDDCLHRSQWPAGTLCRECRKEPGTVFFHCCTCDNDNYEICIACWGKGATCKFKGHILQRVSRCPPELQS